MPPASLDDHGLHLGSGLRWSHPQGSCRSGGPSRGRSPERHAYDFSVDERDGSAAILVMCRVGPDVLECDVPIAEFGGDQGERGVVDRGLGRKRCDGDDVTHVRPPAYDAPEEWCGAVMAHSVAIMGENRCPSKRGGIA